VFNALKINSTLALIGASVAEFFGSPDRGMGFRIQRLRIPLAWARHGLGTIAVGRGSRIRVLRHSRAPGSGAFTFGILPIAHKTENGEANEDHHNVWPLATATALLIGPPPQNAGDPLTLQLKWVTQAQFAGYYVRPAKGFYDAEGSTSPSRPAAPTSIPAR